MKKVCMFLLFISSFSAHSSQDHSNYSRDQCTNFAGHGYEWLPNQVINTFTARVLAPGSKYVLITTTSGSLFKIQPDSSNVVEMHQQELMEKLAYSTYASQTKVDLCVANTSSPWRLVGITAK